MKITAIVPFTGSKDLVEMTRRCAVALIESGVDEVVTFNNAADELLDLSDRDGIREVLCHENIGFGRAINTAIAFMLRNDEVKPTHFLIANNDLEFTDPEWLKKLTAEVEGNYVLSPTTDITACPESRAAEAVDKSPVFSPQVSAFCWLVPLPVIERIQARYGFELFDSHFFAYGEDDLTSAILRKQFGPKPFKVVRRSWVRHLKGKTAKEVGVRSGDPKNLKLLAERKRVLGVR
jgi:hypothetical protein